MKKLINGLIVWACALSLGQKVCGSSAQESREEYLGRLMSPEYMRSNEERLQELMKAQGAPAVSPILKKELHRAHGSMSAPVGRLEEPVGPSASQKEWEAAREDFRKKTSPEYIQKQDRKLQNYLEQEHARRAQPQQAAPREQVQKAPQGSRGGPRRESPRWHKRDYQQPQYKK